MKNYLVAKNLWAIVESDSVWVKKPEAWRRKNAEALHIIQLSCEPKILDEISGFDKAKDAWHHLDSVYDLDLKAKPDIEQGIVLDDDFSDERERLYRYVKKGDWIYAKSLIDNSTDGEVLTWAPDSGRTILHVATMVGHVKIVEWLVKKGRRRLVEMKDRKGYTALALAAHYTGKRDVAECMVKILEEIEGEGSKKLLTITNEDGQIPLLLAAAAGHKEMTSYLYEQTPSDQRDSPSNRVSMLEYCIKAEIFGVAVRLLDSFPHLPDESLSRGFPALGDLAQMPSVFLSGCQFGWLEKIIYNSRLLLTILNIFGIRGIYEQKCTHDRVETILRYFQHRVAEFNNSQLNEASVYDAMLNAAKHGIVEFIKAMREANPDLLWVTDSRKRDIFSYAVLHRKKNVFQLIYTLKGGKDILKYRKDVFGNNLLHQAGYLGGSYDLTQNHGAALQLQREIHWFKAVEKVVHPKCKEDKNNDDKKPREVFAETHKKLLEEGEKWAKVTAKSFTLVGTLLSGIMFAALFTIPGGNHEETGVPIFLHDRIFKLFIIADAVSLFTSITSVVIFIEILTSRFSQNDFLRSLPWKLVAGLFFLFLSVLLMVIASCAALAIVLKEDKKHICLVIAIIIGCIPAMVVLSRISFMGKICRSTISNPVSYIKVKKQ